MPYQIPKADAKTVVFYYKICLLGKPRAHLVLEARERGRMEPYQNREVVYEMLIFMDQLDEDMGCPDIWLNII